MQLQILVLEDLAEQVLQETTQFFQVLPLLEVVEEIIMELVHLVALEEAMVTVDLAQAVQEILPLLVLLKVIQVADTPLVMEEVEVAVLHKLDKMQVLLEQLLVAKVVKEHNPL